FIKSKNNNILLVQVYVDDIIFGATNESLCKEFSTLMTSEFEMSMMGELTFFLGLQVKQMKDGTFICKAKYCKELLKRFEMDNDKAMATPMSTSDHLDKDEKDKNRAGTSGKSKSKSRAPSTTSEERLYYGYGSYLWFDSEEERTRFLTFFSKRVVAPPRIIPERYPELQGYNDLDAQLHQAGLWPFVSRARKEINAALIRAFYSNLQCEDDVLYSLVKSTPIELTVEQLGRIAGLLFQGDDVSHYGGEDWVLNNEGLILNELGITELKRHASGRPTIHSANPDGHLVLYIVTRIIKPRKHGHTIMHGEDLKLIHAIMHSAPINWAKFVMINMTIAASTEHDHLLPYPFLVMDILERFKVTTTVG
ncbi:unnamed protein product, partial [Cuscuta campestris]